jgi:hypothetical protein
MKEVFNKQYYTLDSIPAYRLEYISLRLKWLIDLLELKNSDWPLDCMKIFERLKASQLIPLLYAFLELPDTCDAFTEYIIEHDVYFIRLNEKKANYPYTISHDRRFNFTLAHELSHIALGHALVPRELKTNEEIDLEEAEANELAGRLVMPEWLLLSCNYYSLYKAAEYFMVSKTALWQRLNNLKRLDLLNSRSIKACKRCGNTHFSALSEHCGICGEPLSKGLNGIQRIIYDSEIKTDRYKRVVECPLCKSKHFKEDKCPRCNTYIFNYCSDYLINPESYCIHANPSSSRFCEMCGKPTYFYKRRLLKSWETVVNEQQIYELRP